MPEFEKMATSYGTKVTKDPEANNRINEAVGTVTSDSLAGESLQNSGSFGAGNPKAGASAQPSSSTTTNTTDTSSATKLPPAANAEEREAQLGRTADQEIDAAKGRGKEAGVGPTYAVGSAGGTAASSSGIAPTGLQAGKNIDPAVLQPKGTNLKEDKDMSGKTKYPGIGTEDDPARVAEAKLQKMDAVPAGVSSRNDGAQGGDSKFSGMNGFGEGRDDDAFGPAKGGVVSSFDAFPKTKKTYLVQGRNSSAWTVTLILMCIYLSWSEISRWYAGSTSQTFAVEKGVSHDMQINLDMIVAMRCADLHVNMQDAAGDRTLAGELLRKDPTSWSQWTGRNLERGTHELGIEADKAQPGDEAWDVHEQLGKARKRKFSKTPRIRGETDSCRIFGSLDGNKVQGDFHITARGHGYMEFGDHLDHSSFNFSHIIREMSFGPHYPSLINPLDATIAVTPTPEDKFYKFQYYLSIVPTIYTEDASLIPRLEAVTNAKDQPGAASLFHTARAVKTNQYAVTSQSHTVPDNFVPGVFVKFDIEPIMLAVVEEWSGFWKLVVTLVNVVSGVMVAGSWAWQMFDWASEVVGKRKRRGDGVGVLGTPSVEKQSWD
ncbi:copii-coated vesicle [Pyrenophora seminiperda CCB06]|uniref:Endoplasmic reticulum-Golgi intermediate compartment protein n=1 Tax=Pyrenophora seminiperda CCB06 TaxID=1302712 RepID=A0A3M7M8F7_9PLEO|nr:copii-coated vesicle [Pyrenophora seminiperda CCB06]